MDRALPTDPPDEPVNRIAGLLNDAEGSKQIEVVRAVKAEWSLTNWNRLVDLYRQELDGDHSAALMAFIDRNWEDDCTPMSFIRHSLASAGEPMAGLMLRDLDRTLTADGYALQRLSKFLAPFESLSGTLAELISPKLIEKFFGRIQQTKLRAFALRSFDTLRMAWVSIAKAADSLPKQNDRLKTLLSDLKTLADSEGDLHF